jgi:hypothetical protein
MIGKKWKFLSLHLSFTVQVFDAKGRGVQEGKATSALLYDIR